MTSLWRGACSGRHSKGGGRRCWVRAWECCILIHLVTVALAFRAQVVDKVPMADNDQRIHVLVTPEEVVECVAR